MWDARAVAGGMDRPSHGIPLSERRRVGEPPRRPLGSSAHCWLVDEPHQAGRWPALLIEWQLRDEAWWGRVAYLVPEASGTGNRLVERWVMAAYLERGRE